MSNPPRRESSPGSLVARAMYGIYIFAALEILFRRIRRGGEKLARHTLVEVALGTDITPTGRVKFRKGEAAKVQDCVEPAHAERSKTRGSRGDSGALDDVDNVGDPGAEVGQESE